MVLTLYVDRMSQPSRAVELFCRLCDIQHECKTVRIGKEEHKTADFRAINPLQKLPAIEDSNFRMFESHAILRYLFSTRICPNHWYPSDVWVRAKIDSVLDWHHSNLRRGCASLVFHKVLLPMRGLKSDSRVIQEAQTILTSSLHSLNNVFLSALDPRFLWGFPQPTIADLSLVCEIMELKLLGESQWQAMLDDVPKVRIWINAVATFCSPHFDSVHDIIYKLADKLNKKDESSNPAVEIKSKL